MTIPIDLAPRPVCETCGQPATASVRDLVKGTDETRAWIRVMPAGPVRFGCDAHPPIPRVYETGEIIRP